MSNLKTFIWNILLILLTLAVIVFAYRAFFLDDRVDELYRSIHSGEAGTDVTLLNTVNRLEESLARQADFEFKLAQDPLDLTRVVMNLTFMDNPEFYAQKHEQLPRLSSTILASGNQGAPAAIIRLKGKNLIVREGESFDNGKYQVMTIRQAEMLVRTEGRVLTLPLEKELSKRLAEERATMRDNY
ncbi:MAG: hypothetical protein ISR91_05925 [Candidatus Delongbacteria bacterium]|nr:hypothetical protein [Candidatus Delongbacteria bacterium]